MPVRYPSHLYIRVDRRLRDDLTHAASAEGLTVSAFARRELSQVLHPPIAFDAAALGAEAAASLTMRSVRSAIR